MTIKNYIIKRLGWSIPTFLGTMVIAFFLGRLTPADPAIVALTMDGITVPTAEEILNKRHAMGLDAPLLVQFTGWFFRLLQGDWGNSYITGKSILPDLYTALVVTFHLALVSLLEVFIIALPLGIWGGYVRGRIGKIFIIVLSTVLTSIPSFGMAILLIYFLGESWRIAPTSGYGSIYQLILPGITMGLFVTGLLLRLEKETIEKVEREEYVLLAKAKGLPRWYILYRHILPNALPVIVTAIGNYMVMIIGGSAVVEAIFALPGLGSLVLDAIRARDYTMIQGYVVMVSLVTITINLLIDCLVLWLLPYRREAR